MRRRTALDIAALLCAAAWVPMPSRARTGTVSEYAVKAAFVCKFAGYVEWPAATFEQPDSPYVIGVMGTTPVADEVSNAAQGMLIERRRLAVRRLRAGDPPNGLHVLFLARSHAAHIPAVLAATQGQPVLTVTEQEEPDAPMGIINLVVVGNRVRFDVAPHLAEPGELRISSRMLGVARRVVPRAS